MDIVLYDVVGTDFSDVVNKLPQYINSSYWDDNTALKLKTYITTACKMVIVEYPYFDWEYLSSVYSYYIKATKPAKRECYRLHFYIGDDYCGYIILRPTPQMHIGRIQALPSLFIEEPAYIITGKYSSNILGVINDVNCFQFITQDPEIAMCAQVATWAIVEHAAKLGRNVVRRKIAEITDATWTYPERKIPAKGLTARNIMEVLTSVGLYPIMLGGTYDPVNKNEVLSYIESGIPIIGLLHNENHAVCLIGHGEPKKYVGASLTEFCQNNFENVYTSKQGCRLIMNHKFIEDLIVNDDNYFPYMKMSCSLPLVAENGSSDEYVAYTLANIDSFIVPLSEKIYISYEEVYKTAIAYINSHKFDFPEMMVMRIYIAESAKYKSYALNKISDAHMKKTICRMNMSSFIWCIELSVPQNYSDGLVDSLFIYDSTRHSKDLEPWILIKTNSRIVHFNGEKFIKDNVNGIAPFEQFKNNLGRF